jgi:uncharacterized protein YhdP
VPRIAEFRPTLEQQASRLLGIPVRIGNIVARSNGVIPSLELSDVRLLDAQGREALKLPTVLAALSARSIMGLGFEQLTIDRPELDVRRAKDGSIWVAGLPLTQADNTDNDAAEWVFSQPELVIRQGRVNWTDEKRGTASLALTDVDWVLRNQHRTHAMRLDASPPQHWGGRLSLSGIATRQPLARVGGATLCRFPTGGSGRVASLRRPWGRSGAGRGLASGLDGCGARRGERSNG